MDVLSPTLSAPRVSLRRRHVGPIVLWHLLSLDAPTVAALWTWFIAASVHISLSATPVGAMVLAVWMLYAADRLLDARSLNGRNPISDPLRSGNLEHRHRFHHRHRSPFLVGILIASVALSVLIPRLDPQALHLYLVLGSLVAGYFILIHATGSAHRLPKEIAVGLFFAAAVFIPTVARARDLRPALFPAAVLFALLCALNCLFIYQWEHPPSNATSSRPHPATRLALRHLSALAVLSLAGDLLLALFAFQSRSNLPPEIPLACAASSIALLVLHRSCPRVSPTSLRAAADLALLTPILLLPLIR